MLWLPAKHDQSSCTHEEMKPNNVNQRQPPVKSKHCSSVNITAWAADIHVISGQDAQMLQHPYYSSDIIRLCQKVLHPLKENEELQNKNIETDFTARN